MEELKLWSDIVASIAVAVTGLFVLMKFAPMLGRLIHDLGLWRGEVNSELKHIGHRIEKGFERNDDTHSILHDKLEDARERVSKLEGKG